MATSCDQISIAGRLHFLQQDPLDHPRRLLTLHHCLEALHHHRRHRYVAVAGAALGRAHLVEAVRALPDLDDAACEVDMVPGQAPELRNAHAGEDWLLLKKVEASCDRYLIAGGMNVEAEWEQGPAV